MGTLRDTSIRAKLVAGFGLTFAMIAAVGLFALFQLSTFNRFGTELTQSWLPEIENLNEIKRAMTEHRLLAERRTETTNFRQVAAVTARIQHAADAVRASQHAYGEIAGDNAEQRLLSGFTAQWQFYEEVLDDVFQRLDSGDPQRGITTFQTSAAPAFDSAAARIEGLLELSKHEGKGAAEEAHRTYQRFLELTVIVILLGALGVGAAVTWVTRNISVRSAP